MYKKLTRRPGCSNTVETVCISINTNNQTWISSMKVPSRHFKGTPLAATMKSKNETRPPFAAGLFGCTPSTLYPTDSVGIF